MWPQLLNKTRILPPCHFTTLLPFPTCYLTTLAPFLPCQFLTTHLPTHPPFATGHVIAFQPLQPGCLNILPSFPPPRHTVLQLPFPPSMLTTLPPFSVQDLPSERKVTLKQHFSTRQTGQTCVTNSQAARLIMGGSPFCFHGSSLAIKLLP